MPATRMGHAVAVHLEGMGLMGSMLARLLAERGVSFTWHDTEERVAAWPASTGCIYPGGDDHDEGGHRQWLRWSHGLFERWTEVANYWCNHKKPPHGGRYGWAEDLGWLRMADEPSVHLDAQRLVRETRMRFSASRTDGPSDAERYVVAHGFGRGLDRYVWGWTVPVRLGFDGRPAERGHRPCLYLRKGRFVMVYAYPQPQSQWWYAGSSLIVQREAKELDPEKHYKRWLSWLKELTGGRVWVLDRMAPVQGWRPRMEDDSTRIVVVRRDRRILLPSMWHDGIRHFPAVAGQVLAELGAL